MKKLLTFVVILFCFIYSSCGNASREDSPKVVGTVTDVSSGGKGGDYDATITLAGNDTLYYINRAFEGKFTLMGLRRNLVGKEITITYTEKNAQPDFKHIAEIRLANDVFYTEFK